MKRFTGIVETPQATPHAMGCSDAAPRLCPMVAKGDLPFVDWDDVDYRDADIGDHDEQELAQAIDEAIRRAAKHLPNR